MYVSCSCLVCAKEDYPTVGQTLTAIRRLGFRAVDLDCFENWQHVNPSQLAGGGGKLVAEIAHLVAESSLSVSSLNCGLSRPLGDGEAGSFAQYKAEFAALLSLAERTGCPNVTLQAGGPLEHVSLDEQLAVTVDHLRELGAMAGAAGVTVGLEGHANTIIEKPADALALMRRLWPAVGFTYDPSHFVLQGIDLGRTEELLEFAVHVHVRNASPGRMQETMASGTVELSWLIAALREVGYTGAAAIEYFGGFDKDFTETLALRDRLRELGVADG